MVKPITFLDGIVNLNIQSNANVDAILLNNIKKHYGLNIIGNNASLYDIKQPILLSCHNKLLSLLSSPLSQNKPIRPRDGKFKCKLHYQLNALSWLVGLYENKINGILSSDYGIGKSIEIISLFAYLASDKKIAGPHLIIAPSECVINNVHQHLLIQLMIQLKQQLLVKKKNTNTL